MVGSEAAGLGLGRAGAAYDVSFWDIPRRADVMSSNGEEGVSIGSDGPDTGFPETFMTRSFTVMTLICNVRCLSLPLRE